MCDLCYSKGQIGTDHYQYFQHIVYVHIIFTSTAFQPMVSGLVGRCGVVRSGRWQENSCLGCISETVKCRKLVLGWNIGWGTGVAFT